MQPISQSLLQNGVGGTAMTGIINAVGTTEVSQLDLVLSTFESDKAKYTCFWFHRFAITLVLTYLSQIHLS